MVTRVHRTPPPTMADILRARGKLGPYAPPAEERPPPPPGPSTDDIDMAAVRMWAAANGIEVGARGPVSPAVVEQFRMAQRQEG